MSSPRGRAGRRRRGSVPALVVALAVAVVLGGRPARSQAPTPDRSAPVERSVQRFVSLRADEVNVRVGPGVRYPVKWVFVRKSMPVEVIAEFDTWRKIRDWEGAEGWVHRAMLSPRRSLIVTAKLKTLRRRPSREAPAVARLAAGTVAKIDRCDVDWCRVTVRGYTGWIERSGVWGLKEGETIP